mmetsp:Transcript_13639/g.28684  ORF Transcript_13639/g.28684 Transcript_13639/m.28684 type:complete len:83 (+) Transcript_13639:46-294(+)
MRRFQNYEKRCCRRISLFFSYPLSLGKGMLSIFLTRHRKFIRTIKVTQTTHSKSNLIAYTTKNFLSALIMHRLALIPGIHLP